MRPLLKWALSGTLLATAGVLIWPASGPHLVEASSARPSIPGNLERTTDRRAAVAPMVFPAWAAELSNSTVLRDPFQRIATANEATAPPPPVADIYDASESDTSTSPALPPVPRRVGSMVTPSGEFVVILDAGEGEASVATVGQQVQGGYVVQEVRREQLVLHHPPSGTVLEIGLLADETP